MRSIWSTASLGCVGLSESVSDAGKELLGVGGRSGRGVGGSSGRASACARVRLSFAAALWRICEDAPGLRQVFSGFGPFGSDSIEMRRTWSTHSLHKNEEYTFGNDAIGPVGMREVGN